MRYVSTRGQAPPVGFADALVAGLAPDGGLYVPVGGGRRDSQDLRAAMTGGPVPESVEFEGVIPPFVGDFNAGGPIGYVAIATELFSSFVMDMSSRDALIASKVIVDELPAMVAEAYATFDHPDVCPVVELSDGLRVQELWHGPTLAFKDVALQLVGRLFDAVLRERGQRATIVVATSGDTGSAAIEACVGRDTLDIVVLHPAGRVSEVQRRMMTSVEAPNVHNVAIEGTFDDCQDLVKAMFADVAFRDGIRMSAMNSINWARVMAQITYYVTGAAAAAPDGGPVSFAVPTGNFGNVLAGWYARAMGVPIQRLLIGSNANDILSRWVETGALVAEEVVPTLSPAMDIQVSSNHERLLFELQGRDGAATAELMRRFRALGSVEAPRDPTFGATRVDDDETLQIIQDVWQQDGYLIDPHTAVGIGAARRLRRPEDGTVVCLSTAHPAKFPDAVEKATGIRPELPERLADLLERPEHYDVLGNDLDAVKAYIRGLVS